MGKIEWEEFKGKFPKEGIYLIRFIIKGKEDYMTIQVYDTEREDDFGVCLDNGTARGYCCVSLAKITITGYVYLMDLEY